MGFTVCGRPFKVDAGRARYIPAGLLPGKEKFVMKDKALHEKVIHLLGVGLDGEDGHTRVTKGQEFSVYMGSDETHMQMQALCLALEARLRERGQAFEDLSKTECIALLQEVAETLEKPDPGT